jgi:predicted PurR-regulated permease PerM
LAKGKALSRKSGPSIAKPYWDSIRVLGLYIRGQVLLCLILAALYAAALWSVQVPYWLIIAIVGGLAAVMPSTGSLIPLGLAVLSLDFTDAALRRYLIVLALWVVIQGITFFLLMPRLLHRPLGLKELPALAALLFGSLVFGPVGLLLAVPVLAIGLIFWRHFRSRSA